MTTVSKPRYVVQLIILPKYILENIDIQKDENRTIDKTEIVCVHVIYDTVDLAYKKTFPNNEQAALLECFNLNHLSIYKSEVAKFEDGSPDKLKDISPYQKIEGSDEEYENLSDEEKVKLFEYLEKEHGVENILPVKPRRPRP
ncbi:hypothetical protein F164LOC_18795 [Pectobacterium carotovorum]|nr:hypothetical protein F164LOC_18795 [Pectobacterium carotovorum]